MKKKVLAVLTIALLAIFGSYVYVSAQQVSVGGLDQDPVKKRPLMQGSQGTWKCADTCTTDCPNG
jgi:hypothetical protein